MKFIYLGMALFFIGMASNSFGFDYIGMILFGFAMYFLIKGRDAYDKIIPPKSWTKGWKDGPE